ncbi:Fe-S protein assembly chaperone HscA [Myxococcota bacterium]
MLLDIFDPKTPPKSIGIDLGTTNSIVAYVQDGRPVAISTCDGTALLPSVVHYGPHSTVIVGASAGSYQTSSPDRTIASVKRFMGRAATDAETQRLGSYRFASSTSSEEERVVRFDVGERRVTPVEVSAEILKSLKRSADDHLRAVGAAVITVPAYFDDAQRQATRDAGKLAGLEVLRLINEPTAAALAYGLDQRHKGVFAVFDLGGGTFDITLLQLEDGVFQVKSTGGDSALGGDDMDRAVAGEILKTMGFGQPDLPPSEVVALALKAAKQLKHTLTEVTEATLELPARGGAPIDFSLTRQQFDEWIAELLERTGRACRRALKDAGVRPDQLDGVILVGGATRVPRVRSYVAELFGREPLAEVDPDLAVAYGAAVQAELLTTGSDEVLLLDVLPLSLGIETMGGGVDRILPRNTTIPAGAKATFTTYADRQTGFELHVVQGEREMAKDCRSLARFALRGMPALPVGMARLEVSFHVDENSLLTVRAREARTGREQQVEVKPSYGLSEEQIEDMLSDALDHGEEDFELRRLADASVEAVRIATATRQGLDSDGDLLTLEERARIEAVLQVLADVAESGQKAAAVLGRIQDLDHATREWAGRRMDRAIHGALTGRSVIDVAARVTHAEGVEAHLGPSASEEE